MSESGDSGDCTPPDILEAASNMTNEPVAGEIIQKMNGKKRSDKDLLQLGLPPMELAETTSNERTNYGYRKYINSILQKCIAVIILILVISASYIILLSVLQSLDYNRSTEIIVVTGLSDSSNVTVQQSDIEIVFQIVNKTAQSDSKRIKRDTFQSHTYIPTSNEEKVDNLISKARDVVIKYNKPCNEETTTEICKDLVIKFNSLTGNNNEHNEAFYTQVENVIKDDEMQMIKQYVATEKYKRETLPVMKPFSNPLSPRDPGHLANDYSAYSPHAHFQQIPPPLTDTCLLARLLKNSNPSSSDILPVLDFLPAHYENHPSPYSRYPPAPIPPSYLHSREAEAARNRVHPQDAEIFMKFLTPKPLTERPSNSTQRVADCLPGTLPCNNGADCIPERHWCDGRVHCSDVSDETACTCKSRVDKSRICDGYFDCPFGEDEMGCFGCSESTFSCGDVNMNSQSTCFTKQQRCNNIPDCPNQRDEVECTMLAPSLHKEPIFAVSNTEGFLHRNFRGDWYAVCENPYMWAHDACRRETGLILRPPYIQMVQIDPTMKVNYLSTAPGGMMQTSQFCFNSSAVYVTCPDLLCGTRVTSHSQTLTENAAVENHLFGRNKRFLVNHPYPFLFYGNRMRRFQQPDTYYDGQKYPSDDLRGKRAESRVVGGRPSQPTAWPWMVAMYRDGMFHCGGVILTQNWLISAAHCVSKFWEHYYEIQVGMLRRFSFSPQEQNHRVTHVIVNQRYNQADMRNDLSLLRVQPAIIFSRWVRPVCLPGPETAGSDWLWGPPPGTMCIAVGWGATVEHGPDPDHMREVEVPIWDKCKHSEDRAGHEICAGLVEGGKDACQGDSGGPLLCRNPLNSHQWYMAGIVSHGDGCARKDEPGVYTRVSMFVKWIRFHIFSKALPTIQPKQECPGFKCISGIPKCIPTKRICDKIVDCLNGEDEVNCESASVPMRENMFLNIFERDSKNENHKTKEAELETPNLTTSSLNTNNPLTTEEVSSVTNGMLHDVTEQDRESDTPNVNTESNRSITENLMKQQNVENSSPSSTKPEEAVSTQIFTEDISDSKSSESSLSDSTSTESISIDKMTRGDMSFAVILPKESLESRSSVSDINTVKDADIIDDWTDSDFTSQREEHNMSTNNHLNNEDNGESITTERSKIMNNFPVQTTNEMTLIHDDSQHLSTSFNNDEIEPETKDLLVELLPDASNDHIVTTIQPTTTEPQIAFISPQFSSTEPSSAKIIDEDTGLLDRIKNIISSALKPAKIVKKNRVPPEFYCRRIMQTIPFSLRCDQKADCEDGTDELGCSCSDYLATFDRTLICDGIFDCADGLDEKDCYSCPDEQYLCKQSQLCLPSQYVCDGKPQCPQGEDELDCFALSNGKNIAYGMDGRPNINIQGFLTKKHENKWHIVCEENFSTERQELAALHICRYLGFSSANRYIVKYINMKEDETLRARQEDRRKRDVREDPIHFSYKPTEDDTARHIVIKEPQFLKEQCVPNVTKTCMSLYVFCDQSLYTNFDISQNIIFSRETESANRTQIIWPWAAKVFVEGEYKCTGVLVDLHWALISHNCLWDAPVNTFITVVLGSPRTLNIGPGLYEQVHQVDRKKELYHSRVTLLHLKVPAEYSNMVKPIVLHSSYIEDSKPSVCIAIGQDERNNTIGVLLEETNENCDLHSRCFVRRIQDGNVCSPNAVSDRQWAGVISCQSDGGWVPTATFVDSRGECGVGDRILASEIGSIRSEMKHFNARDADEISDDCDGQRCGRGKCVKLVAVCDGVKHCSDGKDEDEQACKKKHQICSDHPFNGGCACSSGQLKCHNGKCIAKELYRDGRDDCGDGSDEPGHLTCFHYLTRANPAMLCDGVLNCQDRSDEDPVYCKCFAKKSHKCRRSDIDEAERCVAPDMLCDGVRDCPSGDDEETCIGLSAPEGNLYGTGQVMVRSHGVWYSKCYTKENYTRSELEQICKELGFIGGHAKQLFPPKSTFQLKNNVVIDTFNEVVFNNQTVVMLRNSREPIARAVVDESLKNCHPVFIECL